VVSGGVVGGVTVPPDGGAGHGWYFPAVMTGLTDVDDDAIVTSLPSALCGTMPTKRVTNVDPGLVPARASARSSTPDPHMNAAGSIEPLLGVHAVPPGTRTSAPVGHARPTEPPAPEAVRAAASHVGFDCPFAWRK
jgi:hypothetical protein